MTELSRKLGVNHIIAIIIGTVIGSGVFINIPIVAQITGSAYLSGLCWLIGGLIWIPQIMIVAEMATAYPEEGFGYLYLKKAGSPILAFLFVWTAFISSDTPSITIIALSAISSLGMFFPELNNPYLSKALASLLIIILVIPHIRDVKKGGNLQVILTVAKIAPLILLIIVAVFYWNQNYLNTTYMPNNSVSILGLMSAGVAATVWSYAGFPNLLYMAGEIKNPHKTLAKVLIGSVIGVMIIYVLMSICTSSIVPGSELISATGTFVNPFKYLPLFSGYAAAFLAITAFVSMVGATSACIMVQPRIEYAIAKDGLFFKPFAHVHPKFQTPDYSILIQSGLAIIMTIIGGIESLLGYFTFSYILQNTLVYFAIFWLKKKNDYHPTYKVPFWKTMVVISIIVQIFLAYGTFLAYSFGGVISSLVLILSGVPVYFYFKKTQRKNMIEDKNEN